MEAVCTFVMCLCVTVGVLELSKCSNVFFKVSGTFLSSPDWNSQSMVGSHAVKTVLETLGIDR